MKTLTMKISQYISGIVLLIGPMLFGQELDVLVEEALMNSPIIEKYQWAYEVSKESVNEVQTLPNTQFGLGYFVSEPETRTGAQRFKLSVQQMLPWFGTITARKHYAASMADADYEAVVIAKRRLIEQVSTLYYELYANAAQQKVLRTNVELLKTYETMALTAVETGKASAVDVLKLQIRQNQLHQQQEVLEQYYKAKQSEMNTLLNRAVDIQVLPIQTLDLPLEDLATETTLLKLHPELIQYDKLYASVSQSELVNQKERQPNIGFGLDYVNVEKRPDLNFSDNGKDIVMPMVSVSIPIFNKKHKSKTRQHALKQTQLLHEKQDRWNQLKALLEQALNEREASRIRFNTQSDNLKRAKDAEAILVKSYETGTIDFNDILDIQELQLQFQTDRIDAVKTYYLQQTIVNYLTSS